MRVSPKQESQMCYDSDEPILTSQGWINLIGFFLLVLCLGLCLKPVPKVQDYGPLIKENDVSLWRNSRRIQSEYKELNDNLTRQMVSIVEQFRDHKKAVERLINDQNLVVTSLDNSAAWFEAEHKEFRTYCDSVSHQLHVLGERDKVIEDELKRIPCLKKK